jgi:hypothetical protein
MNGMAADTACCAANRLRSARASATPRSPRRCGQSTAVAERTISDTLQLHGPARELAASVRSCMLLTLVETVSVL